MKLRATRLCHGGLIVFLCLVFSTFAAQCQPIYGGITANFGVNVVGGVTMDSFNSADPYHSIWQTGMTYHGMPYGVYSDSLSYSSNSLPSRTADFTLATDAIIITPGDAQIYGFVNVAPGGTASLGANGSVGDLNWVYAGAVGIEPGHADDNMNSVFYSKSLPIPASNGWQASWLPVPTAPGGSTIIGGVTYSLLITNRPANSNFVYYSIGQLTQSIFIDASNVVLYLTNGMNFAGVDQLTLNSNADVAIYSSGNIDFSGRAGISNLTENAHAVSIYDVAGYSLEFKLTANVGPALIYAPSSSVTLISSGGSYDFIGAIFCNEISDEGCNFHYDESLAGQSFPIPPWITQQPAELYVQAYSNVTFSVEAGGPPPLTYQWYFTQGGSSNAVAGATNSSLTITNATVSGRYSVVISNPYGSVASSQAWLYVYVNAAVPLSGTFDATNGQFQLTVSNFEGPLGMPYIVQASTNLTDWVPIYTNAEPFTYTETNNFPQRYYRAVFAP